MCFNREPPAGFRGLDPCRPVRRYVRHLPHWRQEGATYFVTFNLADALPATKRRQLRMMREEWERRFPPPRDEKAWFEYARTVFRQAERWMDAGYGKCWFARPVYQAKLNRSLLHFHDQRYDLGCFVIMANHCHAAIRMLSGFELEDELGAIKRVTSNFVNPREQVSGALWQQESYDRIIRDEEHLYRVVQYIGRNPKTAAVPVDKWCRWINPDWRAAGWDFES